MKNRLGALAVLALLAGCSGQDNEIAGVSQAKGLSSPGQQVAGQSPAGLATLSRGATRALGNAADKGQLFSYSDEKGTRQRGAYTLMPVRLSEEHAIRGVATGVMTVPAPDGSQIRLKYERHEENADGNWSWIGRVIGGDSAQEAVITFGQDAVFGSIPQAVGPALRLTTENGIAYLMKADASKLNRAYRAGADALKRPSQVPGEADADSMLVAAAMAKANSLAKADISGKALTSVNTIDLAIGYSNGFVAARGSVSAAGTRITNLVTIANQALINSNINARIRLVYAVQVAYPDNTDNGDALEQLTGNDGTGPVTIPAALAPLRAARDQYGADLVTLIRDFQPTNNGCGIAWLLGADGTPITPAADAPFAYSVVSDGDYDQGGNTYFCDDITLVHELAHNLGSVHDIANAGGVAGRYPYSYGYKTTAATGNFYTVMAYGDDNQQLYRVFSSPELTTCGGLPCGVANQADNARSLRQTISTITSFRNTVVPIIGIPRQDVNGDGRSDLMFRNQSAGSFQHWLMNAQVAATPVATTVGSAYSLLATADFNGDGRADLVWGNSSRQLYIYLASGAGYSSHSVGTYPAGSVVKGAGDVDGDGKADLVMHNPSSGVLTLWRMNGFTVVSTRTASIGTAYFLAVAGDFNGDGFLDLVWQHSTSRVMYLWPGTGTGFGTSAVIATLTAGWSIVGAGDVDADGKTDLLFRNAATSGFSYWIMNGSVRTRSADSVVSTAYTLSAIGDYNADGRLDLVWGNSARQLFMWFGSGTTFNNQKPVSSYATGFAPVPTGSLW